MGIPAGYTRQLAPCNKRAAVGQSFARSFTNKALQAGDLHQPHAADLHALDRAVGDHHFHLADAAADHCRRLVDADSQTLIERDRQPCA